MALADIILSRGQMIVVLSQSSLGIVAVNTGLNFGSVQAINQLSDKFAVGDSVLFDSGLATTFMIISGQVFYLVNENQASFKEPIA